VNQLLTPVVVCHQLKIDIEISKGNQVPALQENDIHFWFGMLNLKFCNQEVDNISLLNLEQKINAEKFKNRERKKEYVQIRYNLNQVLSGYTGIAPALLKYDRNASGKPFIGNQDTDIHFNLTHADFHFIIAVSRSPIGIDMEKRTREINGRDEIMDRYFHPEERREVHSSLNPDDAFLKIWTQKEAVVKAVGSGIYEDIQQLNTVNQLHKPDALHVFGIRHEKFNISFAIPGKLGRTLFFTI